jgi:DNA helicase IV
MGRPAAHREILTRSHRVPAELLAFANRLLPAIAPDVPAAYSVRGVPDALDVWRCYAADLLAATVEAAVRALAAGGSMAVVTADQMVPAVMSALRDAGLGDDGDARGRQPIVELTADAAPGRASVVPASLVKGLEFDHVVLVDPTAIVAAASTRTHGLRALYVCLTRAVTSLTVVHAGALPAELDGVPTAPAASDGDGDGGPVQGVGGVRHFAGVASRPSSL